MSRRDHRVCIEALPGAIEIGRRAIGADDLVADPSAIRSGKHRADPVRGCRRPAGAPARTGGDAVLDPTDASPHQLDALLEALLMARPTVANDRFDAELSAAIANGHLDPTTARALRYRQRASVRAVETYLQLALGSVVHVREAADRAARADVEADDEAWRQAQLIARQSPRSAAEAVAAQAPTEGVASVAGQEAPVETAVEAAPSSRRRTVAAHLAVVPDYVQPEDAPTDAVADVPPARTERTAAETRQAIRAALQEPTPGTTRTALNRAPAGPTS